MTPLLPDPPVPSDADMRMFPHMSLDVVRLRDSELAACESGEAFRCAVLLWCAAWHQMPAGSLPDDDAVLTRLAGYGRGAAAVKTFKQARDDGGMRGWYKCSDGRWYHPVVTEKVLAATTAQQRQKARTESATKARTKTSRNAAAHADDNVTTTVTNDVTVTKEREEREERKKEEVEGVLKPPPDSSTSRANGHAPPRMPKIGERSEAWLHLTTVREVDEAGRTHAVLNGHYLDVAAERLLKAARINPASFSGDWRPLIGWLDDGIDEVVYLEAVREVVANPNYDGTKIRSLSYFDNVVRRRASA